MATAKDTSLSINLVMNSAINGADFLQASVNKLVSPARTLVKFNLLKATNFPLLKKNMKSLENHLGQMRSQMAHISSNPIRLNVEDSRGSLREARKDFSAMCQDASQTAFFSRQNAINLERGSRAVRSRTRDGSSGSSTVHSNNSSSSSTGSFVGAAAVATVLALPFKSSIEFESKMARVKALSNATKQEFKSLNDTALKLGSSTEWSSGQVVDGMQSLSMKGFTSNETIKAMPGLLSLATAGATDLGTASDISGNILKSFGLEASQMNTVSDILAKTITSSNIDMSSLGDTMKYIAPIAKTAGMSLQETASMAGLLGNIGISGSMAGTTLKSMVLRLSSPTGKARKALSELGISALDAQGNIKNMPLLLKDVANATENMGSGDRLGFIKKVFGTEPAAGINALIEKSGSGALDKYLSVVNDYKGAAKKIADIQLATTLGQMKLLSSAVEGLSISATTGLLPSIKYMIQGFTSATTHIQSFTEKFPNASKWVFGLGAAFVVGSLALAGFGLVASGVGAGLALLFSPVTAIVLGLAAMSAGAIYLYNNFESVRTGVNSLFSGISESLSVPMLQVKLLMSEVGNSLFRFFTALSPVFSAFGSVLGGLGINFKSVGGVIGSAFSIALVPIKILLSVMSSVLDMVSMVIEGYTKVANLAMSTGSSISDGASSAWSSTKNFFGFGDDKKDTKIKSEIPKVGTPVNNINFKSSSLQEKKIPIIPIESVSAVTNSAITETKSFMQNNTHTNNTQGVTQTVTNHVTIHAHDGKIDEDDLYEKLGRVNRRMAHDEQDLQYKDVS